MTKYNTKLTRKERPHKSTNKKLGILRELNTRNAPSLRYLRQTFESIEFHLILFDFLCWLAIVFMNLLLAILNEEPA